MGDAERVLYTVDAFGRKSTSRIHVSGRKSVMGADLERAAPSALTWLISSELASALALSRPRSSSCHATSTAAPAEPHTSTSLARVRQRVAVRGVPHGALLPEYYWPLAKRLSVTCETF